MSIHHTPFNNYIFVTNRHLSVRPFLSQIEVLCGVHPRAIVLREKDLSEEEYRKLAKPVLKICAEHDVPCVLHNFLPAAMACSDAGLPLAGIHLSLQRLKEAQRVLAACDEEGIQNNGQFMIGCSVHAPEEAEEAEKLGASYLFAGHVYATDCKKGLPPRGTGLLRDVCDTVHIPVYAIGGIRLDDREQMREVLECGASGAAVMSACMQM